MTAAEDFAQAQRLHAAGDLAAAESRYRNALADRVVGARAAHYLGVLLLQGGRDIEAVAALESAYRATPSLPDSATLLAIAYQQLQQFERGLPVAVEAVRRQPHDALALSTLGALQVRVGDFAAAEITLRKATAAAPADSENWHYLAIALQRQHRWRRAERCYRRALALAPGDFRLHFNIGLCAEASGSLLEASEAYQQAQQLAPHRVDSLARLAGVQAALCEFEGEADTVALLEQRLDATQVLDVDDQVEPFVLSFLPLSKVARRSVLQRKAAEVQAEANSLAGESAVAQSDQSSAPNDDPGNVTLDRTTPSSPLRIGYLSADFGEHAVGGLIRDLFAAHDRERVRVHAYSLRRHTGDTADRLRATADAFRDCESMTTRQVADAIRADGIDVLIDMAGYTQASRPAVLALRPAPVQLSWLGYLLDYEAPWIDGLLVDAALAPSGVDEDYAERLIRLPGTILPSPINPARGEPDRARFGFPPDVPLFASFNNPYKLDAELVSAWAQISNAVPEARFVVYLPEHARSGFLRNWTDAGASASAIIAVDKIPEHDQAARAASCDLFLDAFRYQAGATGVACAAAGLPMLVREGRSLVARLGVSLNAFLGLDQLICRDSDAYVALAIALAQDREPLYSLRRLVLERVAQRGLFDPRRLATALEDASAFEFAQFLHKT
ncbi:MAG: tetratricopeptide repeat protein [Lysobacteraceae bacterium]